MCVIGAGFAGLAAAYRLKQAGARVIVLEARGRVGGRSWTVRHKDGAFIDYGGQWVGPTQDEFYRLIKEMGCETYPSPDAGRTLQRGIMTDELYRTEQSGAYPDFDTGEKALDSVDALANTIDVEAPWKHPDAQRLDSITFAEWLRQTHAEERVRRYLAPEVGAVPCASAEEISMLHLGWLIKACHGLKILFSDQGGAQQDRVVGGTQPVAQRLAAKLGKSIRTGNPVRRIEWTDRGAVVHADKLSVAARHVVIAVPPALAGAIEYDPIPGTNRTQLMQRWPQGLVIKVQMMFASPFWRDDGLNGTSFDHLSPLGETADSSVPEKISRAGILTGFVYADHARRLAVMSEADRKKLILREVANRFGPKALEPTVYHEFNWSTQPWTRGCFTGFLTPGATTLFGSAVRDPVGPLHWAGTETATDWPSFIDGAIRSGYRAAGEIRKRA